MAEVSSQEKKVLHEVVSSFDEARLDAYRKYKEAVWYRGYSNYRNILSVRIPRRSNLFIPATFQTVETMVAREKSAIWSPKTLWKFAPRRFAASKHANSMSEYAKFDVQRIPHIYRKIEDFLRNLHIFGTAIFKTGWDYEENEYKYKGSTFIKAVRDQFLLDTVSPRNFFPDPVARRLDQCRYVITRSLIDVEDAKDLVNKLEWVKIKSKDIENFTQEYGTSDDLGDLTQEIESNIGSNEAGIDRRFVEVLEYWNQKEDRFIVVVNRQKVVRNTPIPFSHKRFPFVVGIDIPDPEHFWGISTTEVISDLNTELNAIRNNRMDKYNFISNPMWKVKNGSLFDRKELTGRQGGVVRVKDVNDIQPLFQGQMLQSDYVEESNVKQDIQTTSSISDFSLGQPTGGGFNETATGISIISSNADARIIGKLEYLEQEVLIPLGLQWLSLQQQFMKEKEVFYVTGEELEITRDMAFHPYIVETLASTQMANKVTRQNSIVQLAQLVTNNPGVDQKEWLKLVFETFGFDAGKLLIKSLGMQIPPELTTLQGAQQPDVNAGATTPNILGTETGTNFITGERTS
jgi:hypothetical protein